MRDPGTINLATIIGLIIGPGLGTIAAALLLEGFSAGDGAAFAFTAFLGGIYVYGATIPVLVPITLALRFWRIDYILLFAALGYATGLILFVAVYGEGKALKTFIRQPDISTFFNTIYGEMETLWLFLRRPDIPSLFTGPFTGAMVAIRLIAGPRT